MGFADDCVPSGQSQNREFSRQANYMRSRDLGAESVCRY